MSVLRPLGLLAVIIGLASCSQPTLPDAHVTTLTRGGIELISPVHTVDQVYRSMNGPWTERSVELMESTDPQLVWITGCQVEMVGPDGHTAMSDQLMCHVNVDMDRTRHTELFDVSIPIDLRLFTLSQGQTHVTFPKGFGIPMRSDESLHLVTQVLNLNRPDEHFQVRHKVTLDVLPDRDTENSMVPLLGRGIYAMKSLEGHELLYDADFPHDSNDTAALARVAYAANSNALCLPGETANDFSEFRDRIGKRFTGHWIVKPGREVNRTRVTTILDLPYDTTAHYIAVHLHPFAESLELCDLTTGQTVFRSVARNLESQIGLEAVDYYSNLQGLPLFKDHEYELVSVYNNTSDEDQDSMAVMYVYFADKHFDATRIADRWMMSRT